MPDYFPLHDFSTNEINNYNPFEDTTIKWHYTSSKSYSYEMLIFIRTYGYSWVEWVWQAKSGLSFDAKYYS